MEHSNSNSILLVKETQNLNTYKCIIINTNSDFRSGLEFMTSDLSQYKDFDGKVILSND